MLGLDTPDAILVYGFLALLAVFLFVIIALLVQAGAFTQIDIKTCKPSIGELKIAYKFARGPYNQSGALFTAACSLLPNYRTIGIYYDDPKEKTADSLRYVVGLILAENGAEPKPEDVETLRKHNYKFFTLPEIDHAVQTTFPFRNTISVIVSVLRVYPALSQYIEQRGLCAHPFLEICDGEKQTTFFIGPLARQNDFSVPEVIEDDLMDEGEDDTRTENSSRSWEDSASVIRDSEVGDSDNSNPPDEDEAPPQIPVEAKSVKESQSISESPSLSPPPPGAVISPPPESVKESETSTVQPQQQEVAASTDTTGPSSGLEAGGSSGEDESDANTVSSFEEVDEAAAAVLPHVGPGPVAQEGQESNDTVASAATAAEGAPPVVDPPSPACSEDVDR